MRSRLLRSVSVASLLIEGGGRTVAAPGGAGDALLKEDGFYLLLESDGSHLLLE